MVEELLRRGDCDVVMLQREGSCAPHERMVNESLVNDARAREIGRAPHALDAFEMVKDGAADEFWARRAFALGTRAGRIVVVC